MTQTHTPGPWKAELGDSTRASEVWSVDPTRIICDVHSHVFSHEHADARLIAAAPDLLEALKAIYSEGKKVGWHNHPKWSPVMKAASDAISRAEGGAA